jgi:DNA-binding MarR family transcriptional regulator
VSKPVPELLSADLVDPLADLLGYQLRRASQTLMAGLTKDLSALSLSVVEVSVLLVIKAHPGITQSEIGRLLDIRRANMVPLAAKLFARRLLSKDSAGGRAILLTLTTHGEEVVRAARRLIARHEARILPELGDPQRRQLAAWLASIWTSAGASG